MLKKLLRFVTSICIDTLNSTLSRYRLHSSNSARVEDFVLESIHINLNDTSCFVLLFIYAFSLPLIWLSSWAGGLSHTSSNNRSTFSAVLAEIPENLRLSFPRSFHLLPRWFFSSCNFNVLPTIKLRIMPRYSRWYFWFCLVYPVIEILS